jgi:hypothetical protein
MDASTLLAVFAVTLALMGLAVGAMALGSRLTGRCLRGSCGGPAAHGPDGEKISCVGCPNRDRH